MPDIKHIKINLNEKIQRLPNQSAQVPQKLSSTKAFDSILQETLKNSKDIDPKNSGVLALRQPSYAGLEILSNSKAETVVAHQLINSLENYQQLLANPSFSLKMIQPSVDQMNAQCECSQTKIANMPTDSPVKQILQETISTIFQEIEKFNSGYYVDS